MVRYTVNKLAKLAGVSVRTLHLYDRSGLLRPSLRTEAGYRLYGEKELLRLQQILFYKELDIPLREICSILDDPDFDLLTALEQHRAALQDRRDRLSTLLATIDHTIVHLKKGTMPRHEKLYEGLPKEKAEAWRREAIDKYGAEAVEKSENHLVNMGKEGFAKLKAEAEEVTKKLVTLMGEDPASAKVQEWVARHYAVIRQFWGTAGSPDLQAEAYKGLGQLYVSDERFTMTDGKPNPEFALFLSKAMAHFSDTRLR